jgi:hypothetical protein
MTSASATTEQAISGQIGQPAACMMENTGGFVAPWRPFQRWVLQGGAASRRAATLDAADYVRWPSLRTGLFAAGAPAFTCLSTETVDNCVGNFPRLRCRPRRYTPWPVLLKFWARFF